MITDKKLRRLKLSGLIAELEREYLRLAVNSKAAKSTMESVREMSQRTDVAYMTAGLERVWFINRRGKNLPDEPVTIERLSESLPVAWADHRLWKSLHAKMHVAKGNYRVCKFLREYYDLHVPFNDSVWRELRTRREDWNRLRFLMVVHIDHFFRGRTAAPGYAISEKDRQWVNQRLLSMLLDKYTSGARVDWLPWLTSLKIPKRLLDYLRIITKKLSEDFAWCLKHPGILEVSRAPATAHRVRDLITVRNLELMVQALRQNPSLTDSRLAIAVLGSNKGNARKLASEARLLACYRDQIPVTFHKRPSGVKHLGNTPPP
jgi:hypothetical protein